MAGVVFGLLLLYTVNDYLRRPQQPDSQSSQSPQSSQSQPASDAVISTATTVPTATNALAHGAAAAIKITNNLNLQVIDTIFCKWAVNALWDYDTTQVLFYNPADGKFSIPVEITRRGVEGDYTYYYRPIDELTRPLVSAPDYPGAIIRFTENEEATRLREQKLREMWNPR
jgi:hypothetical protein